VKSIILSAMRGGDGKTIFSVGLVILFKKRGFSVVPFKKGPDYIDAGWLAKAAGHKCYNLDLFMIPPTGIVHSFISHSKGSDIAIVEGNRGLYDGMDHQGTYSTAELSKLLNVPVILVVDCTKSTTTISAMIMGCQGFDPDVRIAGVVLNKVATSRQEGVIRRAITERCGIPVLGAIPRLRDNLLPERHMGLTPFHEHKEVEEAIHGIGEIIERCIDFEAILKIADHGSPQTIEYRERTKDMESAIPNLRIRNSGSPRIGVIRDSAFQFYYPENLEELTRKGATIVDISALRENSLPDIDALYIGGGFPETHAIELAENTEFKRSLLDAIEKGLPVYAECGGLMYLGRELVLGDRAYQMVGALPLTFRLEEKPQAHGYTIVEVNKDNPYFKEGTILKGHEFHYSRVIDAAWDRNDYHFVFTLKRGKGIRDGMDGICYRNVLATYTHLHAFGSPEWVAGMIGAAIRYRSVL